LAQDRGNTPRGIESELFFPETLGRTRTGVVPAMAGINHNRIEKSRRLQATAESLGFLSGFTSREKNEAKGGQGRKQSGSGNRWGNQTLKNPKQPVTNSEHPRNIGIQSANGQP
jgi:hypothetical protein